MPLYEYQCDACAHRFEVIQKFSDEPVKTCPACGGPVQKLLSSPAIQFKGSGFYLTDYGRGTGKSDSGSAKAGKTESAGGEAPKSDAAKTDATPSKPSSESKPAAKAD